MQEACTGWADKGLVLEVKVQVRILAQKLELVGQGEADVGSRERWEVCGGELDVFFLSGGG